MKKDLKSVISKVLAGTMLVTSSFAGVVTANAEDMQQIFKYDFEEYAVGDELSQDSSADVYGGPVLAGSDEKYSYAIEDDGTGNKVVHLKDDKDTKTTIPNGKVPEVTFKIPDGPITGKYVISGDIEIEKAKSAKDYVNIVNGSGTQILRLGTGKGGTGTAWGLRTQGGKNIAVDAATGEIASLSANTWYTYQFTVDPTAGTIEAAVKERGAADFTVLKIKDVVDASSGNVIDLVSDNANAIAPGTDLSLGGLSIQTGGSNDTSGVDSWHDNIALSAVKTSGGGEEPSTTEDPITTEDPVVAPAFNYTGTSNGVSISVTSEGALTASGDSVESYDDATKTVTLKADADVTVASLIKDIIDANLTGVKVESGSDGIVVTSTSDSSVTISIKIVKASKEETSTDAQVETSTDAPVEPTTSGEATVDKTYEIGGSAGDVIGTDAAQEMYAEGAVGTKTGNDSLNITGSGKVFVNFPNAYNKGTVSFSSDVILSEGYGNSSTAIFEIWGTDTSGTAKDFFAAKTNNGNYQLKNNAGGTNVDTTVAVKTGQKVNFKLVADLDNDVVSLYVDGVKIATDEGAVALSAGAETIQSLDKVAYFVKEANSASQEVSNIQLSVAASTSGGDETTSTETSTEAPAAGAVEAEKVAVGSADLANLKEGDQIDVTYKLNGIKGINNYTFYVDFDPAVLKAVGPQTVAEADAVTYSLDGVSGKMKLVPEDLITKQMAVVPKEGNKDYDNALGGKADGVKTAAELGRIKLAGVAGLNESSTATTNTDGKLFVIRFEVVGGGSTNVALSPVGGAGSKTDIFYSTPQSGAGAEVVKIGSTLPAEEIVVPTVTTAPEFTYDANGVKIVITADGALTVSGDNVKSFDAKTNTITLNSDSTVSVEALIAAVGAAGTEKAVVTTTATGFTIADAADATKAVTFTVVKADGEVINPPVTGDVKVSLANAVALNIKVEADGITVATETGKGVVKATSEGVIAPIITDTVGAVNLANLTDADFTVTGADSISYDAASKTLTITVGGKEYKVLLYLGGDSNGDGKIGIADALIAVRISNEDSRVMGTITERQLIAADVNGDSAVKIADALLIVRYSNADERVQQLPVFK